jgi:DNA-binding CsgD family transcriptional regulator
MDKLQFDRAYEQVTPKQKQVLQMLLDGETDEAIAQALETSQATVRKHVERICTTLGLESTDKRRSKRADLLALFVQYRPELVSPTSLQLKTKIQLPPTRQIALDPDIYIERQPIETRCYEIISQPGALLRIKAPKQMGKTLLLNKILQDAARQDYRSVLLSFRLPDKQVFDNLSNFLKWFCASVGLDLQISNKLNDQNYWDDIYSSKVNCGKYFENYLLKKIDSPVVLGLDDIDLIFPHPEIAEEFLDLLRCWHEEGKRNPTWEKLRLVLLHSQEVIPLPVERSPFNVGVPIQLREFNFQEVSYLAQQYQLNWPPNKVEKLMNLVGGHPYLVKEALWQIAKGYITFENFLAAAATEEGIYADRLRQHWLSLEQQPQLKAAFKQAIDSDEPVRLSTEIAFQLNSMGLVKLWENHVVPSCNLYRQYFRDRL